MIGHLLNTTVTVHRPTFTPDGRGGRTSAFAPAGEVRAQVCQPAPAEGTRAGQDGAVLLHRVYVAPGDDVRRGDELDTGGPRRLRVVDVVSASRAAYKRLDCEVVQGGA